MFNNLLFGALLIVSIKGALDSCLTFYICSSGGVSGSVYNKFWV